MARGFVGALRAALGRSEKKTVVALAEALGVPNNSLTTWLKGAHHPRPPVLGSMLRLLDITRAERESLLEEFFDARPLTDIGIFIIDPNGSEDAIEAVAAALHEGLGGLGPWSEAAPARRTLLKSVVAGLVQRGILAVRLPPDSTPRS